MIDSITANTPKNAVQYLIGFGLYLLVYGSFDPIKLGLGLASFLITYSAIYPYNDLMDYEEDQKDEFKQSYKALVRGDLKQKTAITLVFGLPIIGLLLASMVSGWYMMLLILLLLMNFLYSAPQIRLKKKLGYAMMIMFGLQVIKFSLGWLTFTTDITKMPVWIIITLSLSYIVSYVLYKKNLLNMKKTFKEDKKLMIPLSALTLFSFYVSLMIYPYKIPLLLLVPLVFLVFMFRKQKDKTKKSFKLLGLTTIILGAAAILLLLLNVPFIARINENTSQVFDRMNEMTLERMNNDTYNLIVRINETLYSYPIRDLKELDNFLNIPGIEVVVSNKSE